MTFHKSIKKFFSIAVLLLVAILVVGCKSENLAETKADLIYLGAKDAVNGSFALPKFVQGEAEAPIVWTSNGAAVKIQEFAEWDDSFNHDLYIQAKVLLAGEEQEIKLTAKVTFGKKEATREFPVTIVADRYVEMTISAAKAAPLKTLAKVSGVVSYTGDSGYAIANEDGTDQMFIYKGAGPKVGDVVVVRGETAEYQKMPQLATSAYEKINQVTFDVETKATVKTLAEVNNHLATDESFFSKLVRLTGMVVETGNPDLPYAIQDPLDPRYKVFVNKYTSAASAVTTKANKNKLVTVNAIIYDYRGGAFTILMPDTFAAGTEYVYDDAKNALLGLNTLLAAFEGIIVTENMVLPVAQEEMGSTVVWESSNVEIIANDGTVKIPNDDTNVTLTITVTVGDKVETGTVEVTVKQLPVSKVSALIPLTPVKAADPKVLVAFEGVVIGLQYNGYWVADETGAMLVYNNKEAKPAVGQVVKVVGELTTYKEGENYTAQIANSSFTVLEKEAPVVIAPVVKTWAELYTAGPTTYAEAQAAAVTYFGKYITITGAVYKDGSSGNYWKIRNPQDTTQFFKLSSLLANPLMVANENKTITITVLVREVSFGTDPSTYKNWIPGQLGGLYFDATANITVAE